MQNHTHASRVGQQHIRSHHIHPPAPPQSHMSITAVQQLTPSHQAHHIGNGLQPHGAIQYVTSALHQICDQQQNRLGHPPHHTISQQQQLNKSASLMHQTNQQSQQQSTQQRLKNVSQQQIQSNRHNRYVPSVSLSGGNVNHRQQQSNNNNKQQKIHSHSNHAATAAAACNHVLQSMVSIAAESSAPYPCPKYPRAILTNTCRTSRATGGETMTTTATTLNSTPTICNEISAIATKPPIVSINQPNAQEVILLNTTRTKPPGTTLTERLSTITEVPQEQQQQKSSPDHHYNSQSLSKIDGHRQSTNDTNENVVPTSSSSSPVKECQLSNAKEKTPMCLVNELARYNKIPHQYRLTGENGPAHSKRFVVTLKLGDEEYSAEGKRIKKAQHLAAAEAIEKTKYKHPLPKAVRRLEDGTPRATITPTVELNALAMKLGQQTYYIFDPRSQPPDNLQYSVAPQIPIHSMPLSPHHPQQQQQHPHPHLYQHIFDSDANNPYIRRNVNGFYSRGDHRFAYRGYQKANAGQHSHRIPMMSQQSSSSLSAATPPTPSVPGTIPPGVIMPVPNFCKITLIVGKQKFIGAGRTLQAAKHDAASRALQVLKAQAANKLNEILNPNTEDGGGSGESPISQVHEIALRRNLSVTFKVIREEGPAHMRNFITECVVGTLTTEGEGNGKKISKKRAAERMLEELKKLPPISPSKSPVRKLKVKTQTGGPGENSVGGGGGCGGDGAKLDRKKRSGATSIQERSLAVNATNYMNPISKLIEITQSHKEKDPVYELMSRPNEFKRREFTMEVRACGLTACGRGGNKKIAKRHAAKYLLNMLESNTKDSLNDTNQENISQLANQKSSSSLCLESTPSSNTQTSTENLNKSGTVKTPSAGQIPGILILRQPKVSIATNEVTKNIQPNEGTNENVESIEDESTENASPLPCLENTNSLVDGGGGDEACKDDKTPSGSAKTTTKSNKNHNKNSSSCNSSNASSIVRPKDQLLYLSQILGFQVDFSDFPKGNHTEFLTIVTLSSVPPQICHGVGANREASQDEAARTALNLLSELGLDNSNSNSISNSKHDN